MNDALLYLLPSIGALLIAHFAQLFLYPFWEILGIIIHFVRYKNDVSGKRGFSGTLFLLLHLYQWSVVCQLLNVPTSIVWFLVVLSVFLVKLFFNLSMLLIVMFTFSSTT